MSQNYNVDDILEEVRRKKARQTPQETARTYSAREDGAPRPRRDSFDSDREPAGRTAGRREPFGREPSGMEPAGREQPVRERTGRETFGREISGWETPDRSPAAESRPASRRAPARAQPAARESADEPVQERASTQQRGGFDFRAPGVADAQQRREQRQHQKRSADSALNDGTGDFSLHFNLDETAEEPLRPKKRRVHVTDQTQELPGAARMAVRGEKAGESRLAHSPWRQSYAEQELLEQDISSEDDYADVNDALYVAKDLKKIRAGLAVRLTLTGLLTALLLYLSMAVAEFPYAKLFGLPENFKLLLPEFMWPESDMRIFLLVSVILCVLAAAVGSNVIGAGLASLARMHADADAPAALAMLAVLVQGTVLVVLPEAVTEYEQVSLYFPVAAAILFFTLAGKVILMNRVWRNFQFLSGERPKNAFLQIQNRDFAREFSRGLGPDADRVSYSASADFLSGFLDKSYSGDYSDTFSSVAAPVSLAGGVLVAVVTAVLSKNAVIPACAFAAVMCICAPFSAEIVPNLMLGRMSKWLTKRDGMLAGYESAEDCAQTSAVLLSDRELFSEESVHLHGMKVFAEKRIDEAILDAASVIIACDAITSGVFLSMIGGNKKLLKKVDGQIYEDGMGLSAWVDGKRVLIGNSELMHNHEIDCPSRDYEARYARDGRKILYIANSGELSAMFVISYNGEPRVGDRLAELQRRGISVALFATDPNITPELVSVAFNVKKGSVRVLPAKLHPEYIYLTRPKEKIVAGVAHGGGLAGMLQVIRASSSVCRSVRAGAMVQLIGIIVGYGLVAFMTFTNSLALVSNVTLLLFGLVAMAVTTIFSSFIKS